MAMSERYRQASRITTRHEVLVAGGGWLAVERIITFRYRSGAKVYHLFLANGVEAGAPHGSEVMSRLRPKVDA